MRIGFILLLFPCWIHAIVLQEEIRHDLELLRVETDAIGVDVNEILDVAIIGGGQSGLSICLALQKQKIYNVAIFDSASEDLEGPWLTTARMNVLRSGKQSLIGLALGIPHLTLRAWYEAKYKNWDDLEMVPTSLWAEYLHWYKKVLHLTVHNQWHLLSILPEGEIFKLLFNEERIVRARKVVLATGRGGCGGFAIPDFVKTLPKDRYFHTGEKIGRELLLGKRVCVVGAGASAFDAAATALEAGAEKVDMVMRKDTLSDDNVFALFPYWQGYFSLSDIQRAQFFHKALEVGIPPPDSSIERISQWENFYLHPKTAVENTAFNGNVTIQTTQGSLETDLVILGTGYTVDCCVVPEISNFAGQILTWGDKLDYLPSKIARFPYIGEHFEFLEKIPGQAPYLKNIYCFNYGAFLSQGCVAGETDLVGIGAERLAAGIATDLFLGSSQETPWLE